VKTHLVGVERSLFGSYDNADELALKVTTRPISRTMAILEKLRLPLLDGRHNGELDIGVMGFGRNGSWAKC